MITKMCHLEESAYSAYVLVPYGSGINYLFSKRVFIKNRQATLKNNFDSLVPSSVVFKKQPWNWKKMYVLLAFYYLIKFCGISATYKVLMFTSLYFLLRRS